MPALCLMLSVTYYAQNYAGIIGWSLIPVHDLCILMKFFDLRCENITCTYVYMYLCTMCVYMYMYMYLYMSPHCNSKSITYIAR